VAFALVAGDGVPCIIGVGSFRHVLVPLMMVAVSAKCCLHDAAP
jgi:hypothetical protein